MVTMRPVVREDYPFLYELLKEKKPEQNISFVMPTYEQHIAFNLAGPYAEDYIVLVDGKPAGRIYLSKQDEVGIHIAQEFRGKGVADAALTWLIQKANRPLLANINPLNVPSKELFRKHGFVHIQNTYRRSP